MGQQQSKFSRRSLLATLPAASVAVAAPAALGRAVDDASLDEAIAACRSAAKSAADFDRSVLAPARTAWSTACDALPHFTSRHAIASPTGMPIALSTESEGIVSMARNVALAGDDDLAACCRELVSAADDRERKKDQLKADLNIAALEGESARMAKDAGDALAAVAGFPVATVSGLLAKLEFLASQGITDRPLDAVLSDLRRIARAQAARA